MDTHGFGMSSVRFICGKQDIHEELEKAISDYFKTEDTILYAACFDANGGVFEPLFDEQDAISRTRSTMPQLSTVYGYVKRNATVTPMLIWRSWKNALWKRKHNVTALL